MRSRVEYERVRALLEEGFNDSAVARVTGIPRRTVLDWRRRPRRASDAEAAARAVDCLPHRAYAYALGLYLGDGCISLARREVWRLRLTLDAAYPAIVDEARQAVRALHPSNRVHVRRRPESRCVDVSMYWKLWPAVFPQHGAGPKHRRALELVPWQEVILAGNHEAFIRGLIHSDGCRYIAHEVKCGRHRYSTRYGFTNRSEDIENMFCRSCDALGIQWTRTAKEVSIYRKDSVDILDGFIGPKS